jgi:hypothetical protein
MCLETASISRSVRETGPISRSVRETASINWSSSVAIVVSASVGTDFFRGGDSGSDGCGRFRPRVLVARVSFVAMALSSVPISGSFDLRLALFFFSGPISPSSLFWFDGWLEAASFDLPLALFFFSGPISPSSLFWFDGWLEAVEAARFDLPLVLLLVVRAISSSLFWFDGRLEVGEAAELSER